MTSTGDGQRVPKLHARIVAGGSVDETNCAIGVAISAGTTAEISDVLRGLQQFLFDLGADLCVPLPALGQPDLLKTRLSNGDADHLERLIDRFTERQAPLNSFVLPGGTALAAQLHVCRTLYRRAERLAVETATMEEVNPEAVKYLNRLSDWFFVAGRIANNDGKDDVLWVLGGTR